MVRLTRIYTKTGDAGTSALASNNRHPKEDLLFNAIGTVDDAHSSVAIAMCYVDKEDVYTLLKNIQNDLFDLGADLASPKVSVTDAHITYLETNIDLYNDQLKPLESFVLPSGSKASSYLHLSRTIVRRAERCVWDSVNQRETNPLIAKYLNRLSDLLFVLARYLNGGKDILWEPQVKLLADGVTGNTPGSGPGDSRFDP